MHYLTCTTANVVTMAEAPVPRPGPGEITVKLAMCGVCGTDTLKVFGDYPRPQKLGHEVVGTVAALGEGVTAFKQGQRVGLAHHVPDYSSHHARRGSETMDAQFKRSNIDPGGFAEVIRVPALHVQNTVVAIPDHVPDGRAVFMEPLACCLRAMDRMSLKEGDTVLVVGVGAIGMLFMPLLRDRGIAALAADVRADRIAVAKEWGAVGGGVSGANDLPELCKEVSEGRGADAVILTVVNDATLKLALDCLRDGGTVMLFGGKPGGTLHLQYWDAFLREINFITSYSATPDGLKRAMALLAGKSFEGIESLISHSLPLAGAQEGFELVKAGKASKVVITP